jgi:predicted short-subunit dehydrogenase-like oxidoreductase (DUF2520 family)
MSAIKTITVIGTGNVSFHLVKAFLNGGLKVVQVVARTDASAERFSRSFNVPVISSAPTLLAETDLYILAVNDDKIKEAARALNLKGQLVVHTSGAVPMEHLSGTSSNTGVFYPLQTLTYGDDVDFKKIPVCIEANDKENYERLEKIARKITSSVYDVDSDRRKILHLAAVFASNFSYHMFTIASALLQSVKVDPDILNPLILETARKAVHHQPGSAQTGPATRKDIEVMKKHLELLQDNEMYADIYRLLSESILKHKKKD